MDFEIRLVQFLERGKWDKIWKLLLMKKKYNCLFLIKSNVFQPKMVSVNILRIKYLRAGIKPIFYLYSLLAWITDVNTIAVSYTVFLFWQLIEYVKNVTIASFACHSSSKSSLPSVFFLFGMKSFEEECTAR